jgi:hypothetical protein
MNATKILARIRAMSEAEVMAVVPPRIIRDIKREDPRPLFKAFVIGQEGVAEPHAVGIGKTIMRWFSSAIKALFMKLELSTKVFNGHEETNEHAGRTPVGEVIGKDLQTINGFLSALAVTYIYPQFKDFPFDVASIEATVEMPGDEREFDVEEADVVEVTGIALGDSRVDTPAFPGATLQAALQAFADKTPHKEKITMNLEEVKQFLQESKLGPSDVFPSQVLISDPLVQERIEDMKDSIRSASIRKTREAEEKITALEAVNKTLADKLNEHEKTIAKSRAGEAFETVLTERPKLKEDDRLSKFVRKQFERSFAPTDEAKLKDELNKFVDAQVAEFADLFGDVPKPAATKDKPAVQAPEASNDEDYDPALDPKKNDLIPED